MTTFRRCVAGVAVAGLAFVFLLLVGCLDSEDAFFGRYDSQRDEFVFLNLYQRIGAPNDEDLTHLHNLWKNRDHVLTPPLPAILGNKVAILRLANDKLAVINLAASSEQNVQPSPVPLDSVRVLPGTFFLRGADALCYYDQVIIPGKVVDQLIGIGRAAATPELAEKMTAELKRRREGEKPMAWDEMRRRFIANLQPKPDQPKPDAKDDDAKGEPENLLQVLSDDSLHLLLAALDKDSLTIVRQKQFFTLALPLTAADVQQASTTWTTLRDAAAAAVKKPGHGKEVEALLKVMDGVVIKTPKPDVFELTLDMEKVFQAIVQIQDAADPLGAPDPKKAPNFPKTIADLKKLGVPIDEKLTIEKVIADFAAGSLKSFPPEKSLPPGEGLFKPAAPVAPAGQ